MLFSPPVCPVGVYWDILYNWEYLVEILMFQCTEVCL